MPRIEVLIFNHDRVGFTSYPSPDDPFLGKSYFFVFDRQTRGMRPVSDHEYKLLIPESKDINLHDMMDQRDWFHPKSSSGEALNVTYLEQPTESDYIYCGPTRMKVRAKEFTLDVGVISALEIIGQQAWLGTYNEGIIVIDLSSGKEAYRVTTKDGLTGNLIRSGRKDPFGANIWFRLITASTR